MGGPLRLRAGREGEAGALSELALRSKAHWGYDQAFLASCRDELRVRAGEVTARRVTVAEEGTSVLGFATLEGQAPEGELGMLFVDPPAIGRGIGRLLYQHVLEQAGSLGFTRLTIRADPHAEGFYRARGAQRIADCEGPGSALVLLVAWPGSAGTAWASAWTGGRPAVHLGNVAEFNAQFDDPQFGDGPRDWREASDHYACLAAFASPHPAVVVLPQHVEDWWVRWLAERLAWGEVEVHGGLGGESGLCDAVRARPELLERIRSFGLPLIPWGRTAQFERIAAAPASGAGEVLRATRHYESKAAAHALFGELAGDHPGISVPAQQRMGSRWQLARVLAARATAGATSVVKTDYGVGGSGTQVVTPRQLTTMAGVRAVTRRLPAGGVLLEDFVDGAGPFRPPTFDAVIGADATVHQVGTGAMDIEGTSYRGVTVGPGAVPEALADTATRFGTAVGRALAADGYRGWYDVDFVAGRDGSLAPTEINLRLTGPAVAFVVQARLDRLHGGRHLVRTLDCLPLGARLPSAALRDHFDQLARRCGSMGVTLLPTIPTAAFDPYPYVGVALAARTLQALDEAESLLRRANAALAEMFRPGEVTASGAGRPGRHPGLRRRS
ncbi:GNAT superfamily N-acetyltransferase [Streptacidiphilus sp. MAP12-16]|uniref:GNAT family N-acetyltransferase n=1 Tax=Streptacidiphilus sp. MAP12-16 TaxID=3156300 RepID=UPI0035185DA1